MLILWLGLMLGCNGGLSVDGDALDGVTILDFDCELARPLHDGEPYLLTEDGWCSPADDTNCVADLEVWQCVDGLEDRLEACLIGAEGCAHEDAEGSPPSCEPFSETLGCVDYKLYYAIIW